MAYAKKAPRRRSRLPNELALCSKISRASNSAPANVIIYIDDDMQVWRGASHSRGQPVRPIIMIIMIIIVIVIIVEPLRAALRLDEM